jgi:hypothetical protein
MTTIETKLGVTAFAPQFLVDDLARSINRHRRANEHLVATAGMAVLTADQAPDIPQSA